MAGWLARLLAGWLRRGGDEPGAGRGGRARSRSRSPAGPDHASRSLGRGDDTASAAGAPLVCLILGGPGSGKTAIGSRLQEAFPGLCHVSCGDLARVATGAGAQRSPLLSSIGRQLTDRRRRKGAIRRLALVINQVLADGLRGEPTFRGLATDGLRATDLPDLAQALGGSAACVLVIDCPRETLLRRLRGRAGREGDGRLGLAEGDQDDVGRVDSYLLRAAQEEESLRAHLGNAAHGLARIDGARPLEECARAAEAVLREAAAAAGVALEGSPQRPARQIAWEEQLCATAARLDAALHPDGRPRTAGAAS